MAATAMSRLDALAREKELLLMRSTLGRLRLRVAVERLRGSRAVVLATRIASIGRIGRYMLGFRATRPTVRYRTDAQGRSPYPPIST